MTPTRELACQQVVELVTAYLDGALVSEDRARFEEHLARCDGCSTYLAQMRETVALTGHVELRLPTELEDRLLEAFRDWREGSGSSRS